jgi:hypothetical protein
MAAQTGTGTRLTGAWHRPRPHSRRERRRRQIGRVVESREGRLVLASTSPTNLAPIGHIPDGTSNPRPPGLAYQQVVAVQTTTLQSLGDSYREVQAAGDQSTGTAISRSGRKSANALVRELHKLGNQLTSTVPVRTSVRN